MKAETTQEIIERAEMNLIPKLLELSQRHSVEHPKEIPVAYIGHEDREELEQMEREFEAKMGYKAKNILGMEYHCPCIKTIVSGYEPDGNIE